MLVTQRQSRHNTAEPLEPAKPTTPFDLVIAVISDLILISFTSIVRFQVPDGLLFSHLID